jgi:enamine deaminase RidA (YjgF/YER057c/UK114 family)
LEFKRGFEIVHRRILALKRLKIQDVIQNFTAGQGYVPIHTYRDELRLQSSQRQILYNFSWQGGPSDAHSMSRRPLRRDVSLPSLVLGAVMSSQVKYVNPKGCAPAQGLYSHIGTADGKLLFVAGQLSVGADGNVVGKNDFKAQFEQIFRNLGDVLRGMGGDFNNVVKFTTYFVHSQDIDLFMKLRAEYFPKWFKGAELPPNTLLVVDRLVKEDFLLEVEAIVHVA